MLENIYDSIPQEELIELCSRSLYTMDGLWFSLVEEKFGMDAALDIDVAVWRRLCAIQAKRLLKTFPLKGDHALNTLINIVKTDPLLVIYRPEIVELTDSRAVFRLTDCPPQKARIRDGRGEFPCKPVGEALFTSYAEVVDSKVQLHCLSCPPDDHPPEYWCEWCFEI